MKKYLVGIMFLALLVVGTNAYASNIFEKYDVIVPAFNGSASSPAQTKSVTGAAGEIYSISVTSGYNIDARLSSSASKGDWSRNINNSTYHRYLYNSIKSTNSTRVQFSNDLTTTVSVTATGQFRVN